jgi:hypothetical protein
MTVDNSLYTNTGGQSFTFQPSNNLGSFTAFYPVLPHGTPVPWLIAHGFPNNFAAAELSDPDGDGIPTWEEYRANTDPQDPNSKFVIRMPLTSDSDGQTQVIFSSSLNRVYRVDSSFDLINWQTVRDNIPGIGADITIPDTRFFPGLTQIFYRVAVY